MNKVTYAFGSIYIAAAALVLIIAFQAQTLIPVLAPPPENATPTQEATAWNQWGAPGHKQLEIYTAKPGKITDPTMTFPVAGRATFKANTLDFPATDVMSQCGSDVTAPFTATVIATNTTNIWSQGTNHGPNRDGLSVTLRSGFINFHVAHLAEVSVQPGDEVTAGTKIGTVGETGDGKGKGCHARIGLSPAACEQSAWWIRRGIINAHPYLTKWRAGEAADPSDEAVTWHQEHGCPLEPTPTKTP